MSGTIEVLAPARRPGLTRRRWWLLGLLATAQLMLVLDVTVVNIALPTIAAQLHLPLGTVPWVMTTYTVAFGGLMLAGGRIADRFGPRRLVVVGLTGFVAASALCGLAPGASVLLAGRALQGLFAAALSPAALAAVLTAFGGEDRRRVMTVWSALAAAGSALGVVLGGVLTSEASWRWIFGINVPVGLVVLAAIVVVVPRLEPEAGAPRRIDVPGAVLITLTTALVIYGVISAGVHGWGSPHAWLPLVGSAVVGSAFAAAERAVPEPLLHVELFARRSVNAGVFLMLTATGLMVGAYFLGSYALQHAHQRSALSAGLLFLIPAVATGLGAHLGGHLLGHLSARLLATAGFLLAAAGFSMPALSTRTPLLVGGLALATTGIGALFVTAFTASLADCASDEAGIRSAVVNTFHELGGAAGVAVLSTAAGSVLVAPNVTGADFTRPFAVGSIIALLSAAASAAIVPPVRNVGAVCGHRRVLTGDVDRL